MNKEFKKLLKEAYDRLDERFNPTLDRFSTHALEVELEKRKRAEAIVDAAMKQHSNDDLEKRVLQLEQKMISLLANREPKFVATKKTAC